MWKRMWQRWTVDKPAALGDWLWQVLVVDFAALLDRLTWRRVVATIPVIILILAYLHRIPIPPELMLLGDVLAYIDIFSMIILIGIFTRMTTAVAVMRQTADQVLRILQQILMTLRGFDIRHHRTKDSGRRSRLGRTKPDDEDAAAIAGLAWA